MEKKFLEFIQDSASNTVPLVKDCIEQIHNNKITCAVIYQGGVFFRDNGRSISGLLKLYENKEEIDGTIIVIDKIIGKAAAMLISLIGASAVYGCIMSKAGREFLEKAGICVFFGTLVERINNMTGDGMCPVEKSVIDIQSAEEGLIIIRKTIEELKARAGKGNDNLIVKHN